MRWCRKCVLPDTRPNLLIGEDGICNACKNHKIKEVIDWESRLSSLKKLVKNVKEKDKEYDCLIPVSGGKDSTWQVLKCLELGLKPLTVTWRTPGRTSIGQQNLDNLRNLGVDHIDYSINPKVEAKFMINTLKKLGTTAIPMHLALFNIPTKIAYKFDIPLIVWGENSAAEYGNVEERDIGHRLDSSWIKRYGVTHGTKASDWVSGNLTKKELTAYESIEDKDLDKGGIFGIFLGYYLKWDPLETKRVAVENGFRIAKQAKTGLYNFADIDDNFISIHHWMKWYKFGFTRLHDNLSIEIRNGRITRDEAIKIIKNTGDTTPREDIDEFCQFTKISSKEFWDICEKFRNDEIWSRYNDKWQIKNYIIKDWIWT
tara:strand:+ start:10104 stop:11219 length:1116 start_codon:yes stop_codon:yes gene_type:complete